jgi:hypothetical protein
MRFEAYIIGEGRTKAIGEEVFNIIRKKSSLHVRKLLAMTRPHIYRGLRGFANNYGIVDPKSAPERRSANTSNHMTLLIDNLPSWKQYPKRSQSLVCSTKEKSAASYGNLYYVYPSDQCKMGIVPTLDIWSAFYKPFGHTSDVSDFNDLLRKFDISDKSWSKLKGDLIHFYELGSIQQYRHMRDNQGRPPGSEKKIINDWADYVSKNYGFINFLLNDFVIKHLTKYWKSGGGLNIIDYLNKELDPKKNGFELNNLQMRHDANEVWIGNAPIILVSAKQKDKLEQEGLL